MEFFVGDTVIVNNRIGEITNAYTTDYVNLDEFVDVYVVDFLNGKTGIYLAEDLCLYRGEDDFEKDRPFRKRIKLTKISWSE